MENTFINELENALTEYEKELNNSILPSALENYNLQSSSCKIIRELLLKKRLIHNDPYKYDSKMTEIEIPDNSTFLQNEAAGALGARLAHYEMMLHFLTNSYQFNTNFLTVQHIAKLKALNDTFTWAEFSEKSGSQNTRELYKIVSDIFSGADRISATVLKGAFSNMSKASTEISSALKKLLYYHRQNYKFKIRKNILSTMPVSEADYENPAKFLRDVKKVFPAKMKKMPFYPELISEILKEEYGTEKDNFRNTILMNLHSEKKDSEQEAKPQDFRPFLISALQNLGHTAPHFAKALEKINFNKDLIDKSNSGFLSKLVRAFRAAFNIKEPDLEVTIFIPDQVTQVKYKERIIYEEFEKILSTKIKVFTAFANPSDSAKRKIRSTSNKDLFDIIGRYMTDANNLISRLDGLDEFFKTVKPELRNKIKGIKIEITTIKNYVLRANQNRAEYITYTDEIDQMKKLGM